MEILFLYVEIRFWEISLYKIWDVIPTSTGFLAGFQISTICPQKKNGLFWGFQTIDSNNLDVWNVFFLLVSSSVFCVFCAEIPSLKPNIFRNLKKWMAYFWKTFFVFLFGKPGFLEGYLNPTPRRPIQATGGLSQITLAMPNEAVNPVPLKKRGSLGPSYVSEKVRLNLIWYQCHVSINIAPGFVMVFVCILAVYVYNYNMYPTTWKQWGWSLLWVLFHFQKISQTYPSFWRYKSKPTWGPMNCTKSAWRMFFWSIHW